MSKAEAYFQEQFLLDLQQVGDQVLQRYRPLVEQYRATIIPFETSRLREHQSLIFENSTLETNKMELLNRVEQLKAENERLEYSLEKQLLKINELERHQEDLERLNLDHQSEIASLHLANSDLTAILERRDGELAQVEKVVFL
jgi:predicted nuclease with TOPRIM domain